MMQVTDEMVRMAAEALWNYDGDGRPFSDSSDELKEYWLNASHAALTAALAAVWRPIEEAPKDRTRVLLYTDELTPPTIQAEWRSYDDQPDFGEWVDVWNNDPIETSIGAIRPAAWMPLPSPPKAEG
jgi:hypothetical protein